MKLYSPPKTNNPILDAWLERLKSELEKLTIEDTSTVNQDLTTDASPTFSGLTLTTGSGDPLVKGWIQFNGTGTIAIQDSFNVSSITDVDTGKYTVTWDTDFANDDYSCVATLGGPSATHTATIFNILTTSVDIYSYESITPAYVDSERVMVIAIGDQ